MGHRACCKAACPIISIKLLPGGAMTMCSYLTIERSDGHAKARMYMPQFALEHNLYLAAGWLNVPLASREHALPCIAWSAAALLQRRTHCCNTQAFCRLHAAQQQHNDAHSISSRWPSTQRIICCHLNIARAARSLPWDVFRNDTWRASNLIPAAQAPCMSTLQACSAPQQRVRAWLPATASSAKHS
jgi:hypothetical protein